jgi:gluconate 2-dehydrogenase gamma chain
MDGALSRGEMAVLEAVLERLIPSDGHGPGAAEAMVSRYVARRLAGPYRHLRAIYAASLRALDAEARRRHGAGFAALAPELCDQLLLEAEARADDPFFELVLAHAMEGMFGDPRHGGNADRVGWRLIGYGGPRSAWTEDEQRLGSTARA